MAGSQEALDRFERQTAWPMMALALAIIPLLVVPLLVDLPSGAEATFFALDWLIWVAFVLEYGIRLYLAPNKRHFVSHNVIDLLFVLIPFLRPLRVVRSARAFALLRATRGAVVLLRAVDAVQDVLKRHKLGYTLLIALVVVVGSGLLVATIEEASPDHNIKSIPDGLWWAVTTITTVGYGDRFPVTPIGRAIGAGVMILGIGLFGLLAASLASLLVEKDLEREIDPQIAEMNERLERIEGLLLERRQTSDEASTTRRSQTPIRLVEIAELLGVTKQRAHQIAEEKGFPTPLAEDARGRGLEPARGAGVGEALAGREALALGWESQEPFVALRVLRQY